MKNQDRTKEKKKKKQIFTSWETEEFHTCAAYGTPETTDLVRGAELMHMTFQVSIFPLIKENEVMQFPYPYIPF